MEGLKDFMAWVDSRNLRKAAVTNAPHVNCIAMLDALGLQCDNLLMQCNACACIQDFVEERSAEQL